MEVRIDYSRTKKPHSPTPGQYMGKEDRCVPRPSLRLPQTPVKAGEGWAKGQSGERAT